jgi:hypothetical protein
MTVTRRAVLAGLAAAAAGTLAGCNAPPQRYEFPELTYTHLPPIRLDVAVVDVVDSYRAPRVAPNVEHLFPTPPATAMARWARDRLVAAGSNGGALFTILRADVVEVPLTRTTGIKGVFTTDQTYRYDATLEIRLDAENTSGLRRGSITARATRSRTVAEDMTLNERERLWFDMTEALMRDIGAEIEKQIDAYLAAFKV